MKPIIDEVIKEIKKNNSIKDDWYDYEIVELAINNVCHRNDLKIKQLYIETLKLNRLSTLIPSYLSLFAIWLSLVAVSSSILELFNGVLDCNKILITIIELILTIIFGYLCLIIPIKDYKKLKYYDSIIYILKKNNKHIL